MLLSELLREFEDCALKRRLQRSLSKYRRDFLNREMSTFVADPHLLQSLPGLGLKGIKQVLQFAIEKDPSLMKVQEDLSVPCIQHWPSLEQASQNENTGAIRCPCKRCGQIIVAYRWRSLPQEDVRMYRP